MFLIIAIHTFQLSLLVTMADFKLAAGNPNILWEQVNETSLISRIYDFINVAIAENRLH